MALAYDGDDIAGPVLLIEALVPLAACRGLWDRSIVGLAVGAD